MSEKSSSSVEMLHMFDGAINPEVVSIGTVSRCRSIRTVGFFFRNVSTIYRSGRSYGNVGCKVQEQDEIVPLACRIS